MASVLPFVARGSALSLRDGRSAVLLARPGDLDDEAIVSLLRVRGPGLSAEAVPPAPAAHYQEQRARLLFEDRD